METIDITREQAEEFVRLLALHLPAEVDLGRPQVVGRPTADGVVPVLTTAGWWWIGVAAPAARRLVPLPDGGEEVTWWHHRVEIARMIDRVE